MENFVSRTFLRIVSIAVVSLFLHACASTSNSDDQTAGMSAKQIYEKASNNLKTGDYESAIKYFENLEARFPYGQYAERAQMEIVYAYYKDNEQESAILAANRFIKLHPNHKNVDYMYYMRGLASYRLTQSFLNRVFDVDPTQRDPKSARRAFQYFAELVKKFPKSRYAKDAVKRMIVIRNRLAKYEVNVANYYLSRGAYLAAANRGKYVVENYQRTPAVANALSIMVKAYTKLGMKTLAADAERVLRLNFPNKQSQ
jgi:outer membrane protein assembly factor BamD